MSRFYAIFATDKPGMLATRARHGTFLLGPFRIAVGR